MARNRRHFLAVSAAAMGFGIARSGGSARAQVQQRFPSIYMFIPAAPGGGWDGLGRAIEQAALARLRTAAAAS